MKRELLLAGLLSLVLPGVGSSATTGPSVVLKDGREIATRAQPAIALGRVSFLDQAGKRWNLPASSVNLPATRARNLRQDPSGHRWTATNIDQAKGRVQVIGKDLGDKEGRDDRADRESKGAQTVHKTSIQIATLRLQLEQLQARMSSVGAGSVAAAGLRSKQLTLQGELRRLLQPIKRLPTVTPQSGQAQPSAEQD